MIFIKKNKNIAKLVQDQFLQTVKDHQYDKFGYVVKIVPCVFNFKFDLNFLSAKKSENMRLNVLKIRWNAHSRICDH